MSGVSANPRSCSPNHSQPAVPAFAAPHNRSAPGSRRALAILTPEGSCYAVHDSRPGKGKAPASDTNLCPAPNRQMDSGRRCGRCPEANGRGHATWHQKLSSLEHTTAIPQRKNARGLLKDLARETEGAENAGCPMNLHPRALGFGSTRA